MRLKIARYINRNVEGRLIKNLGLKSKRVDVEFQITRYHHEIGNLREKSTRKKRGPCR